LFIHLKQQPPIPTVIIIIIIIIIITIIAVVNVTLHFTNSVSPIFIFEAHTTSMLAMCLTVDTSNLSRFFEFNSCTLRTMHCHNKE